jgi:hypothetical protein
MARQHGNTRVTAGRTLIRRYVLALPPAGAGNEAAVTATSVPPLRGGPDSHGSGATHVLTIADSADGEMFGRAGLRLLRKVRVVCEMVAELAGRPSLGRVLSAANAAGRYRG